MHPDLIVGPGTKLGEGKHPYHQKGAACCCLLSIFLHLFLPFSFSCVHFFSFKIDAVCYLTFYLLFVSSHLIVTFSSLGVLHMAGMVETTIPDHQVQGTKVEVAACLMILGHPQGEDIKLVRSERERGEEVRSA